MSAELKLKDGWSVENGPDTGKQGEVVIVATRTDDSGKVRFRGIYTLAMPPSQTPLEALHGACPQAFED